LLFLAAGLAAAPCPATDASAAPAVSPPDVAKAASLERPQDSVWLVSTRRLGCPDAQKLQTADFRYVRYHRQEGWTESDWDGFAAEASELTAVYVHGNREDGNEVFPRGLLVYRTLVAGWDDPQPLRFVIWSWPSTQICGPRRDVQTKAARADVDSVYLGSFLTHLQQNRPTRVGLVGFSFGSRIISGALHLTGGGTVLGHQLPQAEPPGERLYRVVLMAAAMDNRWWLPGHRHELFPSQADATLVLVNPCDRVLKWYPRMDRRTRPDALGYRGFFGEGELGEDGERIDQQNVSHPIGRDHSLTSYLQSSAVMREVRHYVLWQSP
jgi:hypothetical protein